MANPRDKRNIRERTVTRKDGIVEIHYEVRVQKGDKKVRETFINDLKAAQDYRDHMRSQIRSGELGEKDAAREALEKKTVRDLFMDYKKSPFFIQKATHEDEWVRIECFMKHPIGKHICDRNLYQISKDRGKYFLEYLESRRKGVELATVRRELGPIRHMFKIARTKWHLPVDNPLSDFFSGLKEKSRHEIYIPETTDDAKLYDAIEETFDSERLKSYRWFILIRTALVTGLRRGVLLQLKWTDVDLGNAFDNNVKDQYRKGYITIPREYVDEKKNAPPLLPLSRSLCGHLKFYYDLLPELDRTPTSRLFPISKSHCAHMYQKISDRAGFYRTKEDGTKDHMHFHDLRHTAATRHGHGLKPMPLTPDENAYLLGHKLPGMNAYYRNHIQNVKFADSIRAKWDASDEAHDKDVLSVEEIAGLRYYLLNEQEWDYSGLRDAGFALRDDRGSLWQWEEEEGTGKAVKIEKQEQPKPKMTLKERALKAKRT